MNENARRGIQVSIDEVFDHFQELDVDASGKVSKRELERYLAGDDIQHTFIVVFDTADAGITWDDGANLSVVIAAIEPGSPASDNPDVVVGLAIASVNGSALPPGGAHMFKKAWRAVQGEPQLSVEFYEPYIIVHDFAYTLDLEIDTSRKKNNKLTKTAASTSILRERWSHFWFGLHAWINTAISSGEHIESHHRRQQLLIVTAKIGNRAYAFVSDVVEALGDALFFVAPQHFKLESAVRADGKLGSIFVLPAWQSS